MSDTTVLHQKRTKKSSASQAHDNAFHSAMSDIRVARDFLEHHLSEIVREEIDLNRLRMHPTTFTDLDEVIKLASNVSYSAEFKKQACLYMLVIGYLKKIDEVVDYLVQSKEDDYLIPMTKYMMEKSDMKSQFYDWVHNHLSPPSS